MQSGDSMRFSLQSLAIQTYSSLDETRMSWLAALVCFDRAGKNSRAYLMSTGD